MKSRVENILISILTANSWELFLIFLIPYCGVYAIPKNEEKIYLPILGLLIENIWLFWIFIVGIELNKRLPEFLHKSNRLFRFCIVYLIFGFLLLMINTYWQTLILDHYITLIISCTGLIALFYILYFTSRSLKELEKKRNVSFSEYQLTGLLFFIIPIGVWFIQPRVKNAIINPDYKEGVK